MTKRQDWLSRLNDEIAEYRTLAKRANQRMLRIERYSDPTNKMYRPEAKGMKGFAYKIAQRNIKNIFGPGAKRFKENLKATQNQELAKEMIYQVRAMKKAAAAFLKSVSSTLAAGIGTKGIRAVQDKRTQTINDRYIEKYGMEGLTTDELSKVFASKKFQKMVEDKQYGSDYVYVIAATVKQIPTSKSEIREFLEQHIDLIDITEQDLKDAGILNREQALDILENSNKVAELRKLFRFVKMVDSPILNDKIADAIAAGYTRKNLFF